MDHLPRVSNPHEPIDIPYLGGPLYDGRDFEAYPASQQWDIERLQDGDLQGRSSAEAAQFLQSWLYFGMLYEAFRLVESDHVNLTEFLRTDELSQKKYIWCVTTARLPGLFRTWHQRVMQVPNITESHERDRFHYYTRFRNCMELACDVWRHLMKQSGNEQILSHEVLLSIQMLGAALDIGVTEVCGDRSEYTWRVVPPSTWLIQRMIGQGWCPCIVQQLSKPDATFLYYASLLSPPRKGDDHSECRAEGKACVAANVKDGVKYVSKHVVDACKCDYVTIDTGDGSKVAETIEMGDIPVIHLKGEGEGLKVDICSHSKEKPLPYTALSHIWLDGMGDPLSNRLPRCQMNHIAKLLRSLPPYPEIAETAISNLADMLKGYEKPSDYYFWMDTLCVPVKNHRLRQHAINKMRDVYQLAANVLVLDHELMQHPSLDRPYAEIFTRITCSTWLRRLWTLQEATLNRNVLFQFADRAIYTGGGSALSQMQAFDNRHNPWDLVAWECSRYTLNFIGTFPHLSQALRMNIIWDSIRHRTTSRGGDEPLCIGILLELDIDALQSEPDACTVKKFWSLHAATGVPAQVLFAPGPRLQDEGLRWAPEHLLDLQIVGSRPQWHADITPQGLCAQYSGIVLEKLKDPVQSVIACDVDGGTFFIRQNLREKAPSWKGLELHTYARLAVLVHPVSTCEDEAAGGMDIALGALIEVVEMGEENYVRYLRFVSVIKKGSLSDRHPSVPWSVVELEEKERKLVKGAFITDEQKWCIG